MKKQIENIFSSKKVEKKEIPNKKVPIIIDSREKQSLIFSYLVQKNANTKFETLEIGDYLIGDIAIERKTFSDFQSSIINKRLMTQLIELKKYKKNLLIIENFSYNYSDAIIHENAIRGMILSSLIDFEIPIMFTENEEDTANTLIVLAKRFERPKTETSLRYKKSEMTSEEQKQFILEGFPGIGPVTSKNLLQKHKTLQKIFSLSKEKLAEVDSLDETKIKNFKDILEK